VSTVASHPAARPAARSRRWRLPAAGLLAAALVTGGAGHAGAQPGRTTLRPMTAPRWAAVPPASAIIVPTAGRSALKIYSGPSPRSAGLITLRNPLVPGVPLVLAQYGGTAKVGGVKYHMIRVSLPVRPNNTVGWVRSDQVRVTADPWRLDIYKSRHTLLVWRGNALMGTFPVAVGRPRTPTPTGVFYVETRQRSFGDFGPLIFASSGFSDVFTTFTNAGQAGDAAIALHGTNEPATVGHDASHGCIRMYNADVASLGSAIAVGTIMRINR